MLFNKIDILLIITIMNKQYKIKGNCDICCKKHKNKEINLCGQTKHSICFECAT